MDKDQGVRLTVDACEWHEMLDVHLPAHVLPPVPGLRIFTADVKYLSDIRHDRIECVHSVIHQQCMVASGE